MSLAACSKAKENSDSNTPTVDPTPTPTPVATEYTVTFNLNYEGAPAASTVQVKEGETVAKPANPTREGYDFVNWYKDIAGLTVYDFASKVNANLTLYAGWSEKDPGPGPQPPEPGDLSPEFIAADYGVLVGGSEVIFTLDPNDDHSIANREASYIASSVNVTAEQSLVFYKKGEIITSNFSPSGDDTAHANYNNYVGSLEDGYTVQATASAINMYLSVWAPAPDNENKGWVTFFIQGGTSADHDGGGTGPGPITDTKYSIIIGGRMVDAPTNPANENESMALGVQAYVGEELQVHDNENDVTWTIQNLDPASKGFASEGGKIVCIEDGTYDMYIKWSYGNDQIYVGYAG